MSGVRNPKLTPYILFPVGTHSSHIPSQDDVKLIKQTLRIPLCNNFERIRRVSQQNGGLYLKKTQQV